MFQPDYNSISGLISHLNNDELKEILNEDSKFEDLLKDLQQLKSFESEKEIIMTQNKSLAEYNISKEPILVEGREKVQQLAEKGQSLYQSVEQKINYLKTNSSSVSVEDTYNNLQVRASNKDEETEKIAERFLSNDMDVDQFLEQYIVERKLMHILKIKVEKMKELMSRRPIAGLSVPNYVNTGTPTVSNFYPPPISGSVPYPTGILNMPMPGIYRNHF